MAKCKLCGKSGLFMSVNENGLCKSCASRQKRNETITEELYRKDPAFRKLTDDLSEQDRLLEIVLKAHKQYSIDGDCEKAIVAYEEVMLHPTVPLNSNTHTSFLVDLYIKAGQNDKAWGFLNSLIGTDRLPIEKIRNYQAKILKKENRHKDAIEMIMLEHLAKAKWNGVFNKEAFLKAIKPSANKLKLDDSFAIELSNLIQHHVDIGNFDESSLITQYRALL